MIENNFFNQTICYVNGEGKRGKVIGVFEYLERRRVCFLFEDANIGQWFPESSLFVNDPQTETPRNQKEENVVSRKVGLQVKDETKEEEILEASINAPLIKTSSNQEKNAIFPTREQLEAIIKENSSNLVSLNEAITKKIIVDWEVIVKLAQDTHSSIAKAIQTIIFPLPEPNKQQVIEALQETKAQIFKETDEREGYDKRECYIQQFISNWLRAIGVKNCVKARINNGQNRADIVASSISSVIEVKRILDERALWLAVEQVSAYAHKLGMRKSFVVGLPPQDIRKYELVKEEAKRLTKWNLTVIFLDISSETLGLENHFFQAPPDSLVNTLLVFIKELREAIMAYIEAISKATTELLRNAKQQPTLRPS